jgi:hypothetical protein
MTAAEASYLVNAVSGFALVLAGLLAFVLALLMTRQPWRWLLVYVVVVVAGVVAVWYHGSAEPFAARVADVGTSLLLAWVIQVAVVGDFYPGRGGRFLNLVLFLANLEFILTLAIGGAKGQTPLALSFGQLGGFTLGEVLLLVNWVVAVGLFLGRRREIQPEARPLLNVVALLFLAGLLLSVGHTNWIDFGILAYHATWHIVAAFGFVALWAFNEMRFGLVAVYVEEEPVVEAPPEEEFEVVFSPGGELLVPQGYRAGLTKG